MAANVKHLQHDASEQYMHMYLRYPPSFRCICKVCNFEAHHQYKFDITCTLHSEHICIKVGDAAPMAKSWVGKRPRCSRAYEVRHAPRYISCG